MKNLNTGVYVHENGSELIRQVTSKQVGNKIKMCIFTSDKDIPGHVRLTTRTLQYLIIPLLSAALLVVGQLLHLKETMMMFASISLVESLMFPPILQLSRFFEVGIENPHV